MTERTRPSRADTRRRVLDAALLVFAERGIAASSLTEVAAAAGLTKGAVYSNFDSKDALVLALLQERTDERFHALTGIVSNAGSLPEAIEAVSAARTVDQARRAAWYRLYSEFFALPHLEASDRALVRDGRRMLRETLAASLVELSKRVGWTLPMRADQLALVVVVLSNGLALEADIDPAAVPDDLFVRALALVMNSATPPGEPVP